MKKKSYCCLAINIMMCMVVGFERCSGDQNVIEGSVFVNGMAAIASIDPHFICVTLDWWPPQKCDYGTCSWGSSSLLNLNLSNPILLNAIRALYPLKIRLGGSLQDKVIYETTDGQTSCKPFTKNDTEMFGFSEGCLPMSRWDELNIFFRKARALIIFGLNALNGRTIVPDGSSVGAWNSTNAEALIRYTVKKGFRIHGWELGNELCGNGVGTKVAAGQYAADVNALKTLVDDIYMTVKVKPLVIAPGGFFDVDWFTEFISKTPKSLQVATHHMYNLGAGVETNLIDKILNPQYLDETGSPPFKGLEKILKNSTTSAVAWVGESGGAYNSGHHLVSNAFAFSFWYLDQLGMASLYNTKTYCRQTLIGGNYGLLNTTTFAPNPDYYSALLWHQLMGINVLSTTFSGTNKIRAYTHCSKTSKGITLLLINLDGNSRVNVKVSSNGWDVGKTLREEYHLTAQNGDLHSQTMLLNGKVLAVNSSGMIPNLHPVIIKTANPIVVSPLYIVFVHLPTLHLKACM